MNAYVIIGATVIAAVSTIVLLGGGLGTENESNEASVLQDTDASSVQEIAPEEADLPQTGLEIMTTDGIKHLIPLDKILSGGPPKDGIPSIDDPVFDTADAVFMSDSDIVLGVEINGQAKAYPLFILVWHEIVNDVVGGVPISVTYCPLCYTNQVFERTIDGQAVEFGVSGKLYNSNLLMYDRLTDSYWSQALGQAVVGELAGMQLEIVPFDVIAWRDWKSLHQDTLVLTTDTGHIRAYNVDPYEDYFASDRVIFPVTNRDNRLPLKTVILGFESDGKYKAYSQSDVENMRVINDYIAEKPILVTSMYEHNARAFERTVGEQTLEFVYEDEKILDASTRSEWNYYGMAVSGEYVGQSLNRIGFSPGFWFEWAAFHPETDLYGDVK